MSEHWKIYLLIFGAVFLAFQGLRGALVSRAQARRTAKRYATIDNFAKNREEVELLKKRSALTGQVRALESLHKLLVQSGVNITPVRLLLTYGVLFIITFFIIIYALTSNLGLYFVFAVSSVTPAVLLFLFLVWKRSRRVARFGEQLPDVIDIIVRGLKAGHPLPVSISLVGREMPTPAGPEFTVVFDEISYGRELKEALESLQNRVGHPDLLFLNTSIAIAHQTGGNLGEILSRLSKLIRDRFRMRRKIRALSAEGRAGGFVLSIVPPGIFAAVLVLSPGYYAEFWGHPMQNMMLAIALALLALGNFVIYKLVNFKV